MLAPIVDLGPQPEPDHLLDPRSEGDAPSAPIELAICTVCGLMQLVGPRPEGPRPPHGHGATSTTADVSRDRWMSDLIGSVPTGHRLAVEVDSSDNDVTLALAESGIAVKAFEAVAPEQGRQVGLVLAGHALTHVEDPDALVSGIERILAPDGLLAVEFHHVLGLAEGQFDVLSHVHRSYFSLHSLERLLDRHALVVIAAERTARFGGSLRVLAGRQRTSSRLDGWSSSVLERIRQAEREARVGDPEAYASLPAQVTRACDALRVFLDGAKSDHLTVAGYGAAARGTALLNMARVSRDQLPFTVDRSPAKQGQLLPGSRIPIHEPAAIEARRPDYILVLPWPLAAEITAQWAVARTWGARFVVAMPRIEILV